METNVASALQESALWGAATVLAVGLISAVLVYVWVACARFFSEVA